MSKNTAQYPCPAPIHQPARMRLAAGLLCVGLAGVLLFCGLLYFHHSLPTRFTVDGYSTEVPEELGWELTATVQDGRLVVDGWAIELGRYIEKVEIHVLLYNAAEGRYWRIPTAMDTDMGLGGQFEDGPKNYPYGSFVASVPVSRLRGSVQDYEVCLAFSHNQLDVLVHTGEGVA